MKIAIPGTIGVPDHCGGFEHIAGHLVKDPAEKDHELTIYNSGQTVIVYYLSS
jgi:hypothetical protein